MLLDTSSNPSLATTNTHALITTLLQVFCELRDDEAILQKAKESIPKENTTIPFILKILLASASQIEAQTYGSRQHLTFDSGTMPMTLKEVAITLLIIYCLCKLSYAGTKSVR